MADLVNELSWSASRHKLFCECKRAYYYTYYGAWNGWDAAAPERTRLLYRLKNVKTLDMWAGTVVHETVAEALRRFAMKGALISAGELLANARVKLRSGWVEAVNRVWERYPKKTNLAELYFGNGKTLPAEQTERIREKVNGCLQAFAESAVLREILAVSYLNWKPVDQLDSFHVDGLKVWCAVDFAYTDPAGCLRILDWKTGGEDAEALRLQLACYSFFALEKHWCGDLGKLRVGGVFLRDGARVSDYSSSPEILVEAKEQMLSSAVAMRSLLADVAANEPLPEEAFALCGNERICSRCNYRQPCPRQAGACSVM